MVYLDNVTLISVTGINSKGALDSMKYSMRDLKFKECKLITSEIIKDSEIEIVKIPPMNSIDDYSYFMVYELDKYINTSHVLIVQEDGYVVNPDKWDNSFLDYDYIGAPWPLPVDSFSYRDRDGNIQRVGNGGFSLRTKKLLGVARKLNLKWESYYGYYNEDGFYTCNHRKTYESMGCKYAPIEIAARFSHETYINETKGIIPFGFHGRNNYYYNHKNNK